jgi:hypothetical protein
MLPALPPANQLSLRRIAGTEIPRNALVLHRLSRQATAQHADHRRRRLQGRRRAQSPASQLPATQPATKWPAALRSGPSASPNCTRFSVSCAICTRCRAASTLISSPLAPGPAPRPGPRIPARSPATGPLQRELRTVQAPIAPNFLSDAHLTR